MKKELAEQQKRQSESDQFMELISSYKDITALNSSVLNELVQSIEVGAIRMVDSVKHRSIRIRYRQYCYVELFSEDELFTGEAWLEEKCWRRCNGALGSYPYICIVIMS